MMFTKKLREIQEPSVLKDSECPAHFIYPIQPKSVSAIDPILKSIEDVMQNSGISMNRQNLKILLVEQSIQNTCQEQDDKRKLISFHKDFPFLQDDYLDQERSQQLLIVSVIKSRIIKIITNCAILILLIILPIQIAHNYDYLTVLYLFILLMQMILFFSYQEFIDLKEILQLYIKDQIPKNIIIVLAYIMIQLNYFPVFQWLAYFVTLMCYSSTFATVLYQIQKYFVCIFPEQQIYSQSFSILIKVVLIIHILNCYIFQSLQQDLQTNSYFDTLMNITINTVTLNNNFYHQNTEISFALLLSYLFMIIIIIGSNQKYYQLLNEIQIYFKNTSVPFSTKLQIYDELINKQNQITNIQKQLSAELQVQISYNQKITFIQDNFSNYEQSTKLQLTEICTVQHYQSGYCIIKSNQKDDNSLYYLNQGQVSIKLPKKAKVSLTKNSTFGQLSFFTQCLRTATIICDTDCTLYKLQRKQFLDCLSIHDKELFQITKDSIEFQNNLPIKCLCCQKNSHVVAYCPEISYQSITEYRLQIYTQNNQTQSRTNYCRKNQKKIKLIGKNNNSPKLNNPPDSSEDISMLQYMGYPSQDSEKLQSEKILSEKYCAIKGQILSSSRICSLQDTHKLIPQVIQELSDDSMSIQYLEDVDISQKITRKNRRKPQQKKFKNQKPQVQNQYDSDSQYSSPSFKGEQSNSSNQQLPYCGTLIKSQGSYRFKADSVPREGFSSFQAFSGNENQIIPNHFVKDDIDKMHIFKHYYPCNNYDQIIGRQI